MNRPLRSASDPLCAKRPPRALLRGRGRLLAALLILIALSFIVLHKALLRPWMVLTSPHSDYTGFLLPRTEFVIRHILERGALPLWRPSELCGIPTLGNPQIGVFYPPNALALLLGPIASIAWRFALCLLLAGIFTYAYCRAIRLGFFPSLFASCSFMLSGFIAGNVYAGHIQHVSTFVWFPACLFFIERLVGRRRILDAVGLGVCLGLQFLAGHPQYFFYSLLGMGIYFLGIWLPPKRWRPLLLLALALVFFIAVAAVQLFPTVEFARHVTRGKEGYAFASTLSLPPAGLLTFLFPDLMGSLARGSFWGPGFYWEYCGYLGVSALVLAIAGAFVTRGIRARIFILLALFAILFSLGRYLPFHYWLCRLVPPLMRFRVPSRMLFIYVFSVAVLGGMGLQRFAERGRAGRFAPWLVLTFLGVSALILLFRLMPDPFLAIGRSIVRFKFNLDAAGPHTMRLREWLDQVPLFYTRLAGGLRLWPTPVILGLLAVLAILYNRPGMKAPLFSSAVLVLLCAELLSFFLPLIRVCDPQRLRPRTGIVDFLARDRSRFRFMDLSGRLGLEKVEPRGVQTAFNFESGFLPWYIDFLTLVRFRISPLDPSSAGVAHLNRDFDPAVGRLSAKDTPLRLINSTSPFRVRDFVRRQNGLDIMNVKYIALNNRVEHPSFRLVYSGGGLYLYRNERVLPRAFLVPDIRGISDKMRAFSQLARFDPRRAVIVPERGEEGESVAAFRPVTVVSYEPDRILCAVNTVAPCCLVLSEMWYPGWEAYDNGERREILMANYAFRGVRLEPGRHMVSFLYNPLSFRFGRALSVAGLGLALVFCFILGRRNA